MLHRSLCPIFALGLLALAAAPSALHAGQPRTHDGFYLRMCLGGGAANTKIDDPAMKIDIDGSAMDLEVAIGGVIAPNLAMHGTFWGPLMTDPDATIDIPGVGPTSGVLEGDVDFIAVGGGLTYYIMPMNLYLSGSAGFGSINFDTSVTNYDTNDGLSLELAVGKEWWVGKSWGLGLSGGFTYHSIPDGGVPGDWTGTSYALRFSATLN